MQNLQKNDQGEKKQIIQKFQQNGYILRPKALDLIYGQDCDQIILNAKFLFKLENILDVDHIKEALGLQIKTQDTDVQSLVQEKLLQSITIVNSITDFRKTIIKDGSISFEQNPQSCFGNSNDIININLQRFLIAREKIKKNKLYQFIFEKKHNAQYQITDINSLSIQQGFQYTFGSLIELEKCQYYLQDQYTRIRLDLNDCEPSQGFVVASLIYIVYGQYLDEVFYVSKIIQPIIETAKETVDNFGNQDYFGSQEKIEKHLGQLLKIQSNQHQEKKIKRLTVEQQKFMNIFDLNFDQKQIQQPQMIVISDFNLQKQDVINKFRKLVEDINEPLIFVLMGQFSDLNEIKDQDDMIQYQQGFQQFLDILDQYPFLTQNCYFIFIPSPIDVGLSILPQKQAILQQELIEKLEKKLQYFINGSNPCRLSVFGKKILICKNNLLKDLRRRQVVQQKQDFSFDQHLVITLLSQQMVYFPDQYIQPIYAQYVDSMQFVQLPDLLIMSDSLCSQFRQESKNCVVINPGNFKNSGCYSVINLLNLSSENCSI